MVLKHHLKENEAQALWDFLKPMLEYFPEKRISARELLRHPWLKMPNIDNGKLSNYDILRMSFDEDYLYDRSDDYDYFYKNELNCDFTKDVYESDEELNEGDDFSIVLSDANSKPIPNQNVQIFLRDSNGVLSQKSVTTNNEGVGVISLAGLASGQYSVNVTYNGNSSFKPSSAFQNLNIKQTVAEHVSGTDSTSSIHPGFTPSYRDGNLIYGYKGGRWGFVTPTGNFHEIKYGELGKKYFFI